MSLTNLKVATRLGFGFGAVLLGTLLVAAAAWYALGVQSRAATAALDVHVRFTTSVLRVRVQVANMRRYLGDMVINAADAQAVKGHWDSWQKASATADIHVKRALAASPDAESRKKVEKLINAIAGVGRGMTVFYSDLSLGLMKDTDEAHKRVDSFREDMNAADAAMAELFDASMKLLDETKGTLSEVERRMHVLLLAAALIAVLLAAALAVLTARSITEPIDAAVRISETLARGDLTQRIKVRGRDELGRLMSSLNGTAEQLHGIVREIKRSSETVSVASQEIWQGHADLSTRTEEQASSLEQTAASMEQMTATVAQNAENARKASQLAVAASDTAARGGQAVGTVVATMTGISESSKKIADIIGVIDGIAFQTNILALNAAVEAARAGEQGRGFAVVASEVRSLAQRSAAAAKEIRQLISDSVGRIDAGSKQVAAAGETMGEIVASVKRVTDLIAEISAASQEQSQSLTQVSDTVTQLEKVTQQNAAMVEEATAASGSLKEQASTLVQAVGGFKLAEEAQAQPVRAAPAAAAPKPAPTAAAALPRQAKPASAGELKPPRKPAGRAKDKPDEGWEEF